MVEGSGGRKRRKETPRHDYSAGERKGRRTKRGIEEGKEVGDNEWKEDKKDEEGGQAEERR